MGSCSTNKTEKIVKQVYSQRFQIIRLISLFKGQNPNFRRETQFIAFSIMDRLYQVNFFCYKCKQQSQRDIQLMAACLILLASKYNDVKAIKMESILKFFSEYKLSKQKIIELQDAILHALDFALPTQTAYSSLATRINMEKSRSCSQLLLKSMKLLTLSVRQYPMIVLDSNFGEQIYDLVWNKKGTRRIIGIYRNVIKKEKEQQNSVKKNGSAASLTTQSSTKALHAK